MPARPPPLSDISRRFVLGATAAVPALPLVRDTHAPDVVTQCAEWLAIDYEIEQLTLQWANLDAVVMREARWSRMTPSDYRARLHAQEMAELDARLTSLADGRERCLGALAKRPAHNLHGVASKLAVAARMLDGEGGPIHQIVAEAVSIMASHRCSGCGEPYTPAACRYPERL